MRINKKLIKQKNNIKPQYLSPKNISEPKNTCFLHGRFGNNLFQISTLLSISDYNKNKIIIPEWKYNSELDLGIEVSEKGKFTVYNENPYCFNMLPTGTGIKLNGFFQSYKYFDRNKIIELIKLNSKNIGILLNKYGNILDSSTKTTGIHIRRTDFVNLQDFYALPIEYYHTSINELNNETNYFLIFSDDINWCRQNFIGEKFIFIENEFDYICLFLMSLCDNLIIANSSFSWWGAFLNQNCGKIYSPSHKNWFASHVKNNTENLIPNYWNTIDLNNKITYASQSIPIPKFHRKSSEDQESLKKMIEFIPIKNNMVEIGCYSGDSTILFSEFFNHITAIDPWMNNYDNSDMSSYDRPMKLVENVFDANSKQRGNISKIKDFSENAIKNFENESLDFVYIDANHQYDYVKKDIQLWIPKIKKTGYIGGHDYNLFSGVNQAVDEFFANKKIFNGYNWIAKI